MPKIRQALAVLVAAGCCIGFNTFRYPVVREMAAAISAMGPSAAGKAGEKPAAAAKDPASSGSAEKSASRPAASGVYKDGVVCKDGACTIVSPDAPTASVPSSPPRDPWATESKETAEKSASSANSEFGVESKSYESAFRPPFEGPASEPRKANEPAAAREGLEASGETKTAAKLVSTSLGGQSTPKAADLPPPAEPSLIPIHRPKSRPKDPAASTTPPAFEPKTEASQDPAAKTVRHLPAVDPGSSDDAFALPSTLSPELIRDYSVTSVK